MVILYQAEILVHSQEGWNSVISLSLPVFSLSTLNATHTYHFKLKSTHFLDSENPLSSVELGHNNHICINKTA